MTNNRGCYTAQQAADLLGIKLNTFYKWARNGAFPFTIFKLGLDYRIPKESFDNFILNPVNI